MRKLWSLWWLGMVVSTVASGFALPKEFAGHWYDGKAELAGYEYKIRRYGEERQGTAVSIFVTEPFHFETQVKSNREQGENIDNVIKLNLIIDFPTGVYDYNTMLSVFAGVESLEYGKVAKVTFSSQEWCGHTWQQMLFREGRLTGNVHSYFEGEEREDLALAVPPGGVPEDALMLWARGLLAPEVKPGASIRAETLLASKLSRLGHVEPTWRRATLSRASTAEALTVPAGVIKARLALVDVGSDLRYRFWVEEAHPHRIVKWEREHPSLEESAVLLGSDRAPYWQMNIRSAAKALARIGLNRRPPRTP